jgi:hypothetical protein
MGKHFDEYLFGNLNFDFVLNRIVTNEQEFILQIVEEERIIKRINIIENLIPDNTYIDLLIRERKNRTLIDKKRKSAEQVIISNNYHNILELNITLVNIFQTYF